MNAWRAIRGRRKREVMERYEELCHGAWRVALGIHVAARGGSLVVLRATDPEEP